MLAPDGFEFVNHNRSVFYDGQATGTREYPRLSSFWTKIAWKNRPKILSTAPVGRNLFIYINSL